MDIKLDFLKFKKAKKFKKEKADIDVNSYWRLLIVVSLIFILAAIAFGAYFFVTINKDLENANVKTSLQMEKVKKERINNVLNYFNVKSQKTESVLNSSSPCFN
ncbi:MAG TPA: hypothetical protein PLO44_01375 [Candidatus Paceibacterota bacterium]|mgnify:CR=1 FL=1|nr:hypothetical protein [Candidatus Paceibacterota bacterium]